MAHVGWTGLRRAVQWPHDTRQRHGAYGVLSRVSQRGDTPRFSHSGTARRSAVSASSDRSGVGRSARGLGSILSAHRRQHSAPPSIETALRLLVSCAARLSPDSEHVSVDRRSLTGYHYRAVLPLRTWLRRRDRGSSADIPRGPRTHVATRVCRALPGLDRSAAGRHPHGCHYPGRGIASSRCGTRKRPMHRRTSRAKYVLALTPSMGTQSLPMSNDSLLPLAWPFWACRTPHRSSS